jgi:hypothetical protein
VGESLAELRAVRDRVLAAGLVLDGQSDHTVSQSLYLCDPAIAPALPYLPPSMAVAGWE